MMGGAPIPPPEQDAGPARVLGAADAVSVVVGAIVGVGIFFTPSGVALLVGSAPLALAAWALAGVIALAGALAFAELGGLYHGSGAQYDILRDAYGPLVAFLFVFCNATAIQAGATGIIALICAANLSAAINGVAVAGNRQTALAGLLIAGLMLANGIGVRLGSKIQNATVVAKVVTLLAVTGLAAFAPAAVSAPAQPPASGPVVALLAALVPAFFSYGGWQHALWISGEVKDPRRNVPRALVVGVLIVIGVYLAANWAYLHLLGARGVAASHALAFDAVAVVLPDTGRRVVAAAVAISAYGVLNAQLLSGPRLVYGMAKDGRFFEVFARLVGPAKTPVAAILLIGGMAITLLVNGGFDIINRVLSGVVFIDGIFFALTGAALFVLRRRRPDADRPVRVPLYPIVPAFFVLGEIGVVTGAYLSPETRKAAIVGLGWIVAGVVLYLSRFRTPREVEKSVGREQL